MLIFQSNGIYKVFFFSFILLFSKTLDNALVWASSMEADAIVFVLLSFHTHKQIHWRLRSLALCLSLQLSYSPAETSAQLGSCLKCVFKTLAVLIS